MRPLPVRWLGNGLAHFELPLGPNHSRQLLPSHTSQWDNR